MIFNGLQKLSLLDFPQKTAATLFTAGCNFRCPFCHNAPLVLTGPDDVSYDEEEILTFLKSRIGLLDGICITGGEPLLHAKLADFIRRVRSLGLAVKLDTNGSFPDRLDAMIREGLLDYVAVDIKNSPEKYAATVGLSSFDITPVEKTVSLLLEGRVPYEFRTTVATGLHTPEDIAAIGRWIAGAPAYFLQNYSESGEHLDPDAPLSPVPRDILCAMRDAAAPFVGSVSLRGV